MPEYRRDRFSTEAFPERERLQAWRELFGRNVAAMEMEPFENGRFASEAVVDVLPNLVMSRISSSPNRARRTRPLLSDGSDHLVFTILLAGEARTEQAGQDVSLRTGEAVLWSNGHEGAWHYDRPLEFLTLAIPRPILIPNVKVDVDRALLQPFGRDHQVMQLLVGYASLLQAELAEMPPSLRSVSATHLVDLVSLAVGATRDGIYLASQRGLRAARWHAVKSDIAAHLTERDLDIASVCARQKLSPRMLRTLFYGEGTTFADYVQRQRLALAHRRLTEPRWDQLTISAIAYDVGFGDLSHFNHAFRRHFGATPSELRAAGRS